VTRPVRVVFLPGTVKHLDFDLVVLSGGVSRRDGRDFARPGLVCSHRVHQERPFRKHARAVEASMRAYAERYDEDPKA
jgi:hypothetical protein